MTVIKCCKYFSDIFWIRFVVGLIMIPYSLHIEFILVHELVMIEDTFGPTGARHGLIHRYILQGLLIP